MSLATGTRLGAYEILGLIGAGGMGEVYKAKDTRLERLVAIKVLPEHLSQNRERRERFEREARAVSSLNHPRICTLYDVGHDEGIDFIVMEFIEGETLAARLEKGPLSVEEALEIGAGIADGLDNAHRQGVVHRDLKPGNVMLTVPGVKILDFGLAKFATSDPIQNVSALSGLSALPTQAKPLTTEGSIIGTLHYMAPEQLEGDEVDARSDIFALGAVLYEMVTGRKAFEGKSQASLISAIMTSEPPPVSQLQGLTPPALDHVVRTCLAKNPDERWQTSGDVFRQLKWIREGGSQAPVVSSVGAARSSKRTWPSIAAALALGAIVGAFAWSSKPDAPARVARFVATPPSAAPPNTESADGDLAITPDGTRIVYAALHEGRRQLVVRALHELEAAPLTGLGLGLRAPFISPDGNWVGYFDDARLLRRVSILGGPPVTICTLPGGSSRSRGGSWGRDGTIIFATNASSGLWRVAAGGGEPEEITSANGQNHVFPEILPGGKAVLFTVTRGAVRNVQNDQIAVASLAGGEPKILVPGGGSNPRYASSGHIVYGANGTLRAVGFDLARLEVTSAPIPVLSGVVTKTGGAANFRISDDGSLVYVAGRMSGAERVLVWVDRNGREEVLTAEPRDYTFLRISPDGSRLALDVRDQERDVWIWDFTRETLSRFTFGPSVDGRPVWSPDGQQLIFESHRGGQGNVFAKSARGTGQVERLTESDDHQTPGSISPDGSWLVFEEGPSSRNLVLLSLTGEGVPQPLLQTDFNESDGEISPDGRWLAYSSDESGQTEIYVRPFPNVDEGQWQISRQGGNQPLWASDGSELFYLSHEKRLMAVPFENAEGASISLGQAEVVLQQTYFTAGFIGRSYDVSPDGKRFLMIREDTPGGVNTELIYVQNWLQELKRLVPVQ